MAKRITRALAIIMMLSLCFMMCAPSASAWGWGPPGGGNNNDKYEWYEVYVQGNLVASGQGKNGNVYYLGTHYEAGVDIDGSNLTWYINPVGGSSGNFSGTVNLTDYIEIPEGYEVQDYDIEELSINGVNDPYHDMYDNAIITIAIKTLYNESTDETIVLPEVPDVIPTEPTEPTEPEITEPSEPVIPDPVDYEPLLSITKTADKNVYAAGETITWTITVTNIGDDIAYDILVTDPLTSDTWELDYLAPGESCTFTATSTAGLAGSLENTATVTWSDNDEIDDAEEPEEVKSDSDTEIVTVEEPVIPDPVDYEPLLSITKTADKEVYEIGETVTWTIIVTNIGSYLAYDVEVVDPITGDSWYIGYLIPGASRSFTVTATAEEAGSLENTATVTWTDADEIPDDQEPEEVKSDSDTEIVTITEPEVTDPTEPEVTDPTEPEVTDPTEPEVTDPTEPEVTDPTEPEVTDPTEPEVTDPTEPEVTDPTEPEVTDPTEPEVTDPTEPEVTDPTEPEKEETEIVEPEKEETEAVEPEKEETEDEEPAKEETEQPDDPHQPDTTNDNFLVIPDENVPLANVPETGDLSILWAALSVLSGASLVALNKKRDED